MVSSLRLQLTQQAIAHNARSQDGQLQPSLARDDGDDVQRSSRDCVVDHCLLLVLRGGKLSPGAESRHRGIGLAHNDIRDVDDNAFQGIGPEIESVDLSHNRLVCIKLAAVFRHLTRLLVLRMRYNRLVDVDSRASHNLLPALIELDLTGNEFDHVPSSALKSLPALRRLILRDNRVRYIAPSAFASSAFLELIDLGANRFSRSNDADGGGPLTIDRQAFCGLEPRAISRSQGVTDWTGLQQVRLDHNGQTQPDICSLVGIWTLVSIDVSGNPLLCDCKLLNTLRRLMDTAIGLRVDHGTQCASPARLAGRTVADALRHWQPTCHGSDDVAIDACSSPCVESSLSLATSASSSVPYRTGSDVAPCTCAVGLSICCQLAVNIRRAVVVWVLFLIHDLLY